MAGSIPAAAPIGQARPSRGGTNPAVLIHALYHATAPVGFGWHQNIPELTVEQVREEIGTPHLKADALLIQSEEDLKLLPKNDVPNTTGPGRLSFDYYHGRPFKTDFDLVNEQFKPWGYDRDAPTGEGTAARVIEDLRRQQQTA